MIDFEVKQIIIASVVPERILSRQSLTLAKDAVHRLL